MVHSVNECRADGRIRRPSTGCPAYGSRVPKMSQLARQVINSRQGLHGDGSWDCPGRMRGMLPVKVLESEWELS